MNKKEIRYGNLIAIKIFRYIGVCGEYLICRCDCGTMRKILLSDLEKVIVRKCRCHLDINISWIPFGIYKGLMAIRRGMIDRCYKKENPGYRNYGERGIRVDDEWLEVSSSFVNWAANNGWERGLQIDRIDNNGPYSSDNCRFTTSRENNRNRRNNRLITYNGDTKCLMEWSEIVGISYFVLYQRLSHGWPVKKAFEIPVRKELKKEGI